MFLGMSKAFDKVWYKGIIFKLKHNGISGNILSTFADFLKLGKQRMVLNGQLSSWSYTESGVPQGTTNPCSIVQFDLCKRSFRRNHNKCHTLDQNECLGKSMENNFQPWS